VLYFAATSKTLLERRFATREGVKGEAEALLALKKWRSETAEAMGSLFYGEEYVMTTEVLNKVAKDAKKFVLKEDLPVPRRFQEEVFRILSSSKKQRTQ
jgi:hypothetical protein